MIKEKNLNLLQESLITFMSTPANIRKIVSGRGKVDGKIEYRFDPSIHLVARAVMSPSVDVAHIFMS